MEPASRCQLPHISAVFIRRIADGLLPWVRLLQVRPAGRDCRLFSRAGIPGRGQLLPQPADGCPEKRQHRRKRRQGEHQHDGEDIQQRLHLSGRTGDEDRVEQAGTREAHDDQPKEGAGALRP